MKIYTTGGFDDIIIFNIFTDLWIGKHQSQAYFSCAREIDDEIWEEYKELRERLYELQSKIEERFEEPHNKEIDGECK